MLAWGQTKEVILKRRTVKMRAVQCICATCKTKFENSAAGRAKHQLLCHAQLVAHAAQGARNR